MKKIFALLSLLISLGTLGANGEIYIALTNFPAQGPVVDSFRYKLANFKDDDFYFDVEKGTLSTVLAFGSIGVTFRSQTQDVTAAQRTRVPRIYLIFFISFPF